MDRLQRLEEVSKYLAERYVPAASSFEEDCEEAVFEDAVSEEAFSEEAAHEKKAINAVFGSAVICEDEPCESAPKKRNLFFKAVRDEKSCGRKLEDLMAQMDETFSQRLQRLIREKALVDSEVYKRACVDRRHFSKIRNDENYAPSKKTVLAFAIALELSLDETKDLLKSAGYALTWSSKFDVIVAYFIENHLFDMYEINDTLYEYGQPVFE